MTPTSVTITKADGSNVVIPLGRRSGSRGYMASATIDSEQFAIFVDVVRTTPARTPSHARWTEH